MTKKSNLWALSHLKCKYNLLYLSSLKYIQTFIALSAIFIAIKLTRKRTIYKNKKNQPFLRMADFFITILKYLFPMF